MVAMTSGSQKDRSARAEVAALATSSPELRDIRAFCALVDLGSLTATGRLFGETKGAVSRRIARLERALGVSLLRRYPRRVVPTDEGTRYRQQVGEAVEAVDAAGVAVRQGRSDPRGLLRVTAPADLGVALLAPLLAKFLDVHPELRLELVLTDQVLAFDAHQIDVAVRVGERLRDSSLVAHRLCTLEGQLFAAPTYLKKHGTPRSLAELATHRVFKLHAPSAAQRMPRLVDRSGATAPALTEIPIAATVDAAVGRELALAGAGVALLPNVIALPERRTGRLVKVLPDLFMTERTGLFILHPPGRSPAGTRAFREFLRAALAGANQAD